MADSNSAFFEERFGDHRRRPAFTEGQRCRSWSIPAICEREEMIKNGRSDRSDQGTREDFALSKVRHGRTNAFGGPFGESGLNEHGIL
jgi:hypothetical protein